MPAACSANHSIIAGARRGYASRPQAGHFIDRSLGCVSVGVPPRRYRDYLNFLKIGGEWRDHLGAIAEYRAPEVS